MSLITPVHRYNTELGDKITFTIEGCLSGTWQQLADHTRTFETMADVFDHIETITPELLKEAPPAFESAYKNQSFVSVNPYVGAETSGYILAA